MGIINKISSKMGLGPEEKDNDEYLEDEEFDEDEDEVAPQPQPNIPPRSRLGGDKVVDFTSVASLREKAAQQQAEAQAAAVEAAANQPMKVVVIEPKSFDDSQQVSQCLMDKRPVVINFEDTDTDVAHRIVDFISGTVYALDGEIRKISRNVFMCAPKNVTMTSSDESSFGDMDWMKK